MMTFKPNSEQISRGVEALRKSGVVNDKNSFANPFLSYCSSFGATVSQCGLPVALSIYENPDTRAKNRERLSIAIKEYLEYDTTLSEMYVGNSERRQQLSDEILSAVVVLKVALRMFEPVESDKFKWPECTVAYSPIKTLQEMRGTLDYNHNIGYLFNHYGVNLSTSIDEAKKTSTEDEKESVELNLSDRIDEARKVNVEIYKKLKKCGFEVVGMIVRNPGLIIGGGLPHGEIDDKSYKTGLQFDYTSGLPVIPGSSVKGVIRSAFPNDNDDESRMRYIFDILKGLSVISDHDALLENYKGFILRLRDNMFGLADKKGMDVFADALVVGHDGLSNVIAEDYLTPHTGGPLDPPIPIRIVKVCAGVIFSFCYKFSSFQEDGMRITADKKKNICTSILEDFGIGAKTNVGYGCLKRL